MDHGLTVLMQSHRATQAIYTTHALCAQQIDFATQAATRTLAMCLQQSLFQCLLFVAEALYGLAQFFFR